MSQMKTPGFIIKSNAAALSLASRYDRSSTQPNPAPEPNYKDDIIDRINAEQNVSLNDGPTLILDVQPDYRFPLITVIYHVIRIYATLDQRNNPIITPASLTAYCMSIIYGFALISDSENIRITKSTYADAFTDNPVRRDLLLELERSFVPPFLRNILTGLMPTSDPRRPNISFVNTFAGFNSSYDYGRTFPISMFLKAHHLVATRPSNSNPTTIFNDWLLMPVTQNAYTLHIAKLLGAGAASGTYDNWLLTRIRTLFNPVTSRSNTTRPTFSPITTFPYDITSWEFNPYIYLLNADKDNIYTTLTFIKSMSSIINEQLSGSTQLGSLFDTPSGVQIMTHFYQGPALPTWHWFTPSPNEKEITATTFATVLKFLTPPTNGNDHELPYPENDNLIDKLLYLVKKTSKHDAQNDPRSYIEFDSDEHVTPDVRYFDPYNYSASSLPYTMMTGLLIETEEIDGFTVPQPNINISLFDDNAHVLQSAVPLKNIRSATSIGDAGTPTDLFWRSVQTFVSPKIGVSLYDFSINALPYFDQQVSDAQPSALYGFDAEDHHSRFTRAFSKFGFRLPSMEQSKPANIPDQSLYAWSSYRYVNTAAPRATPRTQRVCMLLNFRTIYGTNVTLSQSVHPSRLIPLA